MRYDLKIGAILVAPPSRRRRNIHYLRFADDDKWPGPSPPPPRYMLALPWGIHGRLYRDADGTYIRSFWNNSSLFFFFLLIL